MTDSIAAMLLDRAGDSHPGLRTRDRQWSWDAVVAESRARMSVANTLRDKYFPVDPAHIGVLLPNDPEFIFWLGGAALAGATIVGINPTRGDADLAADIRHADCRVIVTDTASARRLAALDTGVDPYCVLIVDEPEYSALIGRHRGAACA